MNNKLLSGILVVGIAATGFAGYSSADDSTIDAGLTNVSEIFDNTTNAIQEKTSNKMGKRKGMSFLSDDEKEQLETMTDDEKKVFFEEKRAERKAEKEAHKAIISKLLDGETLSDVEKTQLKEKQAEHEAKSANKNETRTNSTKGAGKEIIAKLLNGESLSTDEQATLEEMKAKRDEREAIRVIKEKEKSGSELTDTEQAQLDAYKSEHKGKKGKKGKGAKGERGEGKSKNDRR